MINCTIINNDIDLYYQLNLNKNEINKKKFNKNEINTNEIEEENYDIINYEKLIESMYNDIDINNDIDSDNDISNLNPQKLYLNNKKKSTKKKVCCDNCNSDDIIEDTSQGILVCRSCGQVVSNLMDSGAEWSQYNDDNKKDMNRCSHPISQLLPQSSTATTISGTCSSRIKTLHGWSAMPYKERSLNEVFKIIQKKCIHGKIVKCIEDDAKIMYKNISNCKHINGKNIGKSVIIRGKNRTSVIAACILFACICCSNLFNAPVQSFNADANNPDKNDSLRKSGIV